MASSTNDTVSVTRSSGKVEELSAEELEQLNYERKVRDQESTGRLVTPKQVNIFAVALCIAVLFYALPKIFFGGEEEQSTYIPLSERDEDATYDDFLKSSQNGNRTTNQDRNQSFGSISGSEQTLNELPEKTSTPPGTEDLVTSVQQPSAEALALMKEQQEVILRSEVLDNIQQWASAWAAQDVDAYLSHYSEKFISDKGMNLDEWKTYRSSRVRKPDWVQVMLLDIDIEILSDSRVNAQFTQNYSASNYQDVSSKALSLEASDSGWKILAEVSLN